MLTTLRVVELLSLAVWLGGMVFFAFFVAPAAFAVLPNRHLAGSLVGWLLPRIHLLGLVCGLLFLVALALEQRLAGGSLRVMLVPAVLILLVLLSSGVNHYVLAGQMTGLRADMKDAFGGVDQTPKDDPLRSRFGRLHGYSSLLMTVNLALVLGLFVLAVRRLH
jgi:hypothetical protein